MPETVLLILLLISLPSESVSAFTVAEKTVQKQDCTISDSLHISDHQPSLHEITSALEYVTKNRLEHCYEVVNNEFFEHLKHSDIHEEFEQLKRHVQHILLIDEGDIPRRLSLQLENKDPQIGERISYYWSVNNPAPWLNYNKALFDFWERLNYAQHTFTYRTNTHIGTDDRGIIYLKYGDPDLIDSGTLTPNRQRLQGWIRDFMIANGNGTQNFSELANAFNANYITQHFNHIRYSIWVYQQPGRDNLIFIFGDDADGGRFSLKESLDDFIPSMAFRQSKFLLEFDVGPSLFLQLMLYDHFSHLDNYFSRQFSELRYTLLSPNAARSPSVSRAYKQTHRNQLRQIHNRVSTKHVDSFNNNDIRTHEKTFITVNRSGETEYFTFIFFETSRITYRSLPGTLFIHGIKQNGDTHKIAEKYFLDHQLDHSVFSHSHNAFKAFRIITLSQTLGSQQTEFSPGHHIQELSHYAEKGTSENHVQNKQLYLNDLIIGSKHPEQSTFNNTLVPFDVNYHNELPNDHLISIYTTFTAFEQGTRSSAEFEIKIRIYKTKDRFFLFGSSEKDYLHVHIDHTSAETHNEYSLDIDPDELEQGDYTLEFSIHQKHSGYRATNEVEFSVI